jgi:hypothetical protein
VASYDYLLFGLNIRSELELGDLDSGGFEGEPDVSVATGWIVGPDEPAGYSARPDGILLHIPQVARFLIRKGREIIVAPADGASQRDLRLFLLGSAFGALLHQRGAMPLHANAIELDGRAIAFCGPSGAGKSTIAAWFNDRGHPVLADDLCVIDFDEVGRAFARQGLRRLRLWKDALEATGRCRLDFEPSFDSIRDARDKYDVPIHGGRDPAPVPIAAIYLLDRAAEGAESGIVRLHGVAAVEALVSNTYRGGLLPAIGGSGTHLMTCVRIAGQVPIFRAERDWGLFAFDAGTRALEAHARALLAP